MLMEKDFFFGFFLVILHNITLFPIALKRKSWLVYPPLDTFVFPNLFIIKFEICNDEVANYNDVDS